MEQLLPPRSWIKREGAGCQCSCWFPGKVGTSSSRAPGGEAGAGNAGVESDGGGSDHRAAS